MTIWLESLSRPGSHEFESGAPGLYSQGRSVEQATDGSLWRSTVCQIACVESWFFDLPPTLHIEFNRNVRVMKICKNYIRRGKGEGQLRPEPRLPGFPDRK